MIFYEWTISIFAPLFPVVEKNVSGKNILITGGGSGLGQLMAIEFARKNARIILWDINQSGMKETSDLIIESGAASKCYCYTVDVSDRHQVKVTAEKVMFEVGDIDILINNAGVVSGMPFLKLPEEKIIKTMEVNSLAHFWTCKAFYPRMVEKKSGHIVTVSSMAGFNGGRNLSDYCASKFAAVGLHESLWYETRVSGLNDIDFTLVAPFQIDTGMFAGASSHILAPVKPRVATKHIVNAVLRRQEFVTIPTFLTYLGVLKFMIPYRSLKHLNDLMGGDAFMERFTGRGPAMVK
jgi:all-trans-retinol dehydrogenase (NAD+)